MTTMRRYILTLAVALTSLFTACENTTELPAGVGTLCLSEISATLDESTRSVDTSAWSVELRRADGGVVGSWAYGSLPESVELREGTYNISVASADRFAEVSREGYFEGSQSVTIESGKTTTPDAITCRLQSLKVSVEFRGEIVEALGDDCTTTVSLGDVSLTVGKDDSAPIYFRPSDAASSFHVVFEGTVDGAAERFVTDIVDVKVGQWRKVVITMTYEDGERVLDASIAPWISDDDIYVEQ